MDAVILVDKALRFVMSGAIAVYRVMVSPDHSALGRTLFPYGHCRYHPSCSSYAQEVLKKTNALRALTLIVWRVARCNPWSRGGFDWHR
jgi:hypothetical protein